MTLFFSLLPLYLFGNLHCFGMCGPLVMLLGQHHYRFFYFIGRLLSFSLAGLFAGAMGNVLHVILKPYYFAEALILLCGMSMIGWGFIKIFGKSVLVFRTKKNFFLNPLHQWVSNLMLKDTPWAIFLFGFLTIALPCGQTLIVFAACALEGEAWTGFWNGFAFALLTSPSLFVAMHTLTFFRRFKQYDHIIIGGCAIFAGLLACLRGLAEVGIVEHLILNPGAPVHYHFVIY